MHTVAFASGDLAVSDSELRERVDEAELIIAVDGGLRHCLRLGVRADLLVGDLDSVPAELVETATAAGTEVRSFPVDKDQTDLELALGIALERGASSVNVLGLFGGRVDHEIANIALLALRRWAEAGCRVWSDDGHRSAWVVRDHLELALAAGTTVSLIPWAGDAVGVNAAGLKWPLHGATLTVGSPRGVSNVTVRGTQTVSVERGVLLVVVDRSED